MHIINLRVITNRIEVKYRASKPAENKNKYRNIENVLIQSKTEKKGKMTSNKKNLSRKQTKYKNINY